MHERSSQTLLLVCYGLVTITSNLVCIFIVILACAWVRFFLFSAAFPYNGMLSIPCPYEHISSSYPYEMYLVDFISTCRYFKLCIPSRSNIGAKPFTLSHCWTKIQQCPKFKEKYAAQNKVEDQFQVGCIFLSENPQILARIFGKIFCLRFQLCSLKKSYKRKSRFSWVQRFFFCRTIHLFLVYLF